LSGEGGVDNPIRCCKNCCCLFLPLPNGFQARFFPLFFDKLPGLMRKMRWKIESVIPFNWTDRNIKRLLLLIILDAYVGDEERRPSRQPPVMFVQLIPISSSSDKAKH